jgi:hypothetical protein
MTPDQIAQIQTISNGVEEKLLEYRQDLGKRFENQPQAQHARIYGEMQTEINAARQEVRTALTQIQQILTPEQWNRIPPQVREPFGTGGRGGRGGRGGGRGGGDGDGPAD